MLVPLALIMPCGLSVMLAAASLIAAAHIGRAARACLPLWPRLAAWFVGYVSVGLACVGIESLAAYGGPPSCDAVTFIEPLRPPGQPDIAALDRRRYYPCVDGVTVV